MKLYGKYSEKRLSEMDTRALVELCQVKPDVAVYLLKNKPQIFGGFNPELLRKSYQLNVQENIKFYKGYYLYEIRNINDETRSYVDKHLIDKIHDDYLIENDNATTCCLVM